jgi:hypothetical protein
MAASTEVVVAKTRRKRNGAANLPEVISDSAALMTAIAAAARDPKTDVVKMERLTSLWERIESKNAESAFNVALAAAQTEMRPIATDSDNSQTHSRYASYTALDRALRPIFTKHGFSISYNTGESKKPDHILVIAYVSHAGHTRTYTVDMPNDGKGAKGGDVMTKTHATGAAMTYGMRYLLKMIFNVAVGEDDRDGNGAGAAPAEAPAGYEKWAADMEAVADEGTDALQRAWSGSRLDLRNYAVKYTGAWWAETKSRASRVKVAA